MKRIIPSLFLASMLGLPLAASAAFAGVKGIIQSVGHIVALIIPLLVALALLAFFFGLMKLLFAKGDEAKHTEAKSIIIYGLISLFVMLSVWGIVGFLQHDLGLPATSNVLNDGPDAAPCEAGVNAAWCD